MRTILRPVSLWAGMYLATLALFYLESKSLTTALAYALLSSGIKTGWSLLHHKLWHRPIELEEDLRT
jgi:hypothetical protein